MNDVDGDGWRLVILEDQREAALISLILPLMPAATTVVSLLFATSRGSIAMRCARRGCGKDHSRTTGPGANAMTACDERSRGARGRPCASR